MADLHSAAPCPSLGQRPFCLLVVADHRSLVWAVSLGLAPNFSQNPADACLSASILNLLEAFLQPASKKQVCAEREEHLFIPGVQCHMVPARHLVPYNLTHFPIPPSCTALSYHAGTISHNPQLMS